MRATDPPIPIELLRERYDGTGVALTRNNMPGMKTSPAATPQPYSKVGFAHEYRPLAQDELQFYCSGGN